MKSDQMERGNNTDLALKIVLFAGATLLGALLIYQLRMLIVCIIIAITLASAIAPIAEAGERRKIPRLVTVLVSYLAAVILYATLAASLAPTIKEQWHRLIDNLPAYTYELNQWYQSTLSAAGNHSTVPTLTVDDIKTLSLRLLHQTLDMSAGFFGLIFNTLLALFLSAYFVVEANKILAAIVRWVPPPGRQRVSGLILPLSSRMGGYVRGQLLVAIGVAMFLIIGLSVIGVKYALVLGILAGLLNLVPYVGSFIACAFAVVVAFNQAPLLAAAVLIAFGVEQWVESTFLVPFLLGKQASLHPLIVLIAIIAGGTLMGIPGAIIGVPLASVFMYLVEEFYVRRYASPPSAPQDLRAEASLREPTLR